MGMNAVVIEHLPLWVQPYLRLMRFDQPTGIWLLFWPAAWALLLARRVNAVPVWELCGWLLVFWLGALLMRGVGCVLNDMADIRFDREVARTRNRPLASGEIALWQGWLLVLVLLAPAFALWWLLPGMARVLCLISLPLVAVYPFMKRLTWWPQLFLGVTFNAVLPAYATLAGRIDVTALTLFTAALLWTLGYDTLYAHQDKEDDVRVGVKSTALRLGGRTKPFVAACYTVMMLLIALALRDNGIALAGLGICWLLLLWQALLVDLDDREAAGRAFRMNRWIGGIIALAVAFALFQANSVML